MPPDEFLFSIFLGGALLAAYLVFVAYFMAVDGMFNDTRFGRAVFYTGIAVWGLAALVHQFAPDVLRGLDITTGELVLYGLAAVALAGLIGAIADAVVWLTQSGDT
jgi:hypothetical protein